MSRRPRKYEQGEEDKIALALIQLREVRDILSKTNCPKLKSKVQAAISSALGAQRNVQDRKFDHQQREGGLR